MAVNVDTVYQTVLSTLNKEQRGYVTPQEFNLFAEQAQLDIFEQYFYDINQFGRLHGNSTEYSDMLNILEEKISIFEGVPVTVNMANTGIGTLPTNYRLGNVIHTSNGVSRIVEKLNKKSIQMLEMSPLTTPNLIRPAYTRTSETTIQLYPASIITGITCDVISKPVAPNWGYVMVFGEALYNSTTSINFQLHQSEEVALVEKILEFAGLSTKEVQTYQIANQEEMQTIQQEKS